MSTGREKWRRTSPLAALFYLGRVLEHVTRNLTQTLVPLAAFLLAAKGDLVGKAGVAVVAFIMITFTIAILRYWFFGYRITDESVLIREGVFRKTQLDIKFDRIQAINLEQNIVFRAFNLVTVKFDTAGSAQMEGYLPAIKKSWADELKGRLRPVFETGRAREDGNVASTGSGHENESADPAGGATRPILTLPFRDIVRVGLSNNRSLIFLAFLAPLADSLDEIIRENVSEEIVAGASANIVVVGISEGTVMALLIFAGVMIFIAFASISGALLRFHQFTVFAGDDVFRSIGGLLTRHEHSIPFNKIQSVIANQGVMLRVFSRFRLRVRQATSGRSGKCKSFVIPLADRQQLSTLVALSFQQEFPDLDMDPQSARFRSISMLYLRSRFVMAGLVPAMLAAMVMAPVIGLKALWVLIWIGVVGLFYWQKYRRYGVQICSEGLAVRSGLIGFRVVAHLFRKVQRVTVVQSPMQRRKGMATLRFFLASGSVTVPYMNLNKALKLRDFVLYQVESSQLAWH